MDRGRHAKNHKITKTYDVLQSAFLQGLEEEVQSFCMDAAMEGNVEEKNQKLKNDLDEGKEEAEMKFHFFQSNSHVLKLYYS